MKNMFMILLCTVMAITAHAETRTMTKIDADHASVKIVTDDPSGVQAASYVDAQDNKKFIEMLLADPNSQLSKLKFALEAANCDTHSTPDDAWIPACGQVELTDSVMTSFGRGGWMEAGAGYTMFMGFRFSGTGHFFDAEYMML